ncbi:alanine racemase [Neolewinella lacunae]|uniref:Alanine racemase n=1 Tax=Neolewinella lacunae TaxID=1517758 RepID=A0A923PG85_9BACT|nr:alanine racemase [Neolewinella lacunae]MBC6993510.1 alanine racemase [Neolewinella lacunae]MDN3636214.1 alanine racemase [Neolewinella lacunae]
MNTSYDGSAAALAALYATYGGFDLLVDSRRLTQPARTLFFALPGSRVDGHSFLGPLVAAGVRHFVVRHSPTPEDLAAWLPEGEEEAPHFIVTEAVLDLLQDLAAHHRRQFTLPVLAITGSNGKTIVKDWLAEALGRHFRVCASPRSFNSQIGVPLSVWQLRPEHEIAIFEAGISEAGEMDRLARIIQPTLGLFTVLGSAHAAGFASEEAKHLEKLRLFNGVARVIVAESDVATREILAAQDIPTVLHRGVGEEAVEVVGKTLALALPPGLPGIYRENAYATAAAAYSLGLEPAAILEASRLFQPLANRLEQRAGLHGGPVINDSYSNDRSALAAALDFAEAQNPFPRLCLILGTLQSTGNGADLDDLLALLRPRVSRLITVGQSNAALAQAFQPSQHFATVEALLAELDTLSFGAESILVKGASRERFDRIADALSRQQHRTLLRLDLSALRHNFAHYRSLAGSGMIVMVKASAYGGGSLPVARALASAGAEYLAVAYADEGKTLRAGGITLPIMVLNAEPFAYHQLESARLEPVVYDLEGLRQAARWGLRVHLELDTGMGRLGFGTADLPGLLAALPHLGAEGRIASVFTHLAASEAAEHDAFTREQITQFAAAWEAIVDALGYPPPRHVLNTNGISRFRAFAYEFVRLGIGLYGIGDPAQAGMTRPVLQLSTRVSQVYTRPAGTSVGYGRRGRLEEESQIAVLSIGYADGLPRLAGEGRFAVLLHGKLAPTVGAICMDMTMVDVSAIPEVRAGDEAIIFGPSHPIELLATAAQTIPYELLTGIGERVHRVYSGE